MYNLSNATTTDGGFLNVVGVANDVTGGVFWLFVTITLWIILTVAMQKNGVLPAIVTASFVTGVVGILFVLTGLVGQGYLIFYLLSMGLAVAASFVAGKGEN